MLAAWPPSPSSRFPGFQVSQGPVWGGPPPWGRPGPGLRDPCLWPARGLQLDPSCLNLSRIRCSCLPSAPPQLSNQPRDTIGPPAWAAYVSQSEHGRRLLPRRMDRRIVGRANYSVGARLAALGPNPLNPLMLGTRPHDKAAARRGKLSQRARGRKPRLRP